MLAPGAGEEPEMNKSTHYLAILGGAIGTRQRSHGIFSCPEVFRVVNTH